MVAGEVVDDCDSVRIESAWVSAVRRACWC